MTTDYTSLIAWLRDFAYDDNEHVASRAADAIESQAREIAELRAERDHLASRYDAVVREQSEHCKDCCCARSWEALGITKYTGKSIPEHIEELRQRGGDVLAVIHGDGGHHTDAVGFDRSCADAVERWYGLIIENDALRARAEAAEKAIKEHNDGCVAACEARQRGDYGQDCSAWTDRKKRCLDCARDSMIDYPAAIAAGGDDAKD